MKLDKILFFLQKNTDFSNLFSNTNEDISESVFAILNKYIQEADTSGDGVISTDEINVFYDEHYDELVQAIEKELTTQENANGDEVAKSFINILKEQISSDDAVSVDISDIEGISKDDFMKNVNNDTSEENVPDFWKAISEYNPEDIFNTMDEDGDGFLSKEELEKYSGIDNNNSNLSLTDLSNFVNDKEQDVSLKEADSVEEDSSIEETAASDNTPAASSTSGGGGGGSSSTVDSSNSGTDGNTKPIDKKERTEEQIKTEIKEQEDKKTDLQTTAQNDIKEQEDLIAKAMEDNNLSEELQEEYNSENERYNGLIQEKDSQIEEQKTIVQDNTALVNSYDTAISSISSEITSMESKCNSLDPSKDAELISQYKASIDNLKAEKENLEDLKTKAQENIKEAENKITEYQGQKKDLTDEKDKILENLAEKYKDEKEKIEKVQEEIKTYQDKIKEIQENLEKEMAVIEKNIQELKNEMAQIQQAAKTDEIIKANEVEKDRTPTALSENIQNVNWEDYGYDPETGKKFADSARNVQARLEANGISVQSNCLGGVKNTFIDVTGSSPFGLPEHGITQAKDCANVMANNENYREITGISAGDLKYLPAGAVVVWSGSTGVSNPSASDKYGHISISLGDGRESSATVVSQYRSVGHNGTPRVFIPI